MSIEVKELNVKTSVKEKSDQDGSSSENKQDLQKLKKQIMEEVMDMVDLVLEKRGLR